MKLIFIYNAKSDFKNRLFDFAHKIISPSTYKCDLCMLTFDKYSEKESWKDFVSNSSVEFEFYHSDEFENRYSEKFQYPVILEYHKNRFKTIIDKTRFSKINNLDDLKQIISDHLKYNSK